MAPPRRGAGSSLPPPPRSRRFPKAEPAPEPEPEPAEDFPQAVDEEDDRKAVAERVLETAAELERLIKGKSADDDEDATPFAPEPTPPVGRRAAKPRASATLELYLVDEEGELEPIKKARYIIGRGKHCDMVINSGKVSREHAVITKENGAFFIEDLGSSNGTWFKKQRIKKQQIEDGDEFYICADKVKFALR
ncbi:MAG: FHA domain-containing protein [Myxococcaceae bacterium]|nr:FHA domain-containing protein [Myxococcaceae bacterium]